MSVYVLPRRTKASVLLMLWDSFFDPTREAKRSWEGKESDLLSFSTFTTVQIF